MINDPAQLIVLRENGTVVGHAVWHESTIEEHRKGDSRTKEDGEALRKLLDNKKDFVQLSRDLADRKVQGKRLWRNVP